MGSQFAIVYDILIAVVLVFAIFSGAKRGFVSAVVGIAAVFVGFFCAMTFSTPLTELVYTSMVEKPLTETVSQTLDDNNAQRAFRNGFRQREDLRDAGF